MSDPTIQKFGWKRKIGGDVSKSASTAFEEEAKGEEDAAILNGDVDWLHSVVKKRSHVIGLEDGVAKADRLIQEGGLLASSERYWEAIKKWDEALQYTPGDSKIHEMKAQALMELCEAYPAVECARKAVQCEPTCWIAHQTLGRAQLCVGEVRMAVRSFSTAVHLNPGEEELWEEDLKWAWSLLEKRNRLDEEKKAELEKQKKGGVTITEIIDDGNDSKNDEGVTIDASEKVVDIYRGEVSSTPDESGEGICDRKKNKVPIRRRRNKRPPSNFVQMRDPQPP